eukprot:GHVO01028616.1.p1 GENE.GHVO01028616.1~~GHVO01028616.1.p1  ORF type:complete len:279 (+),score=29.19 GHVO01028616.1:25-861(+)
MLKQVEKKSEAQLPEGPKVPVGLMAAAASLTNRFSCENHLGEQSGNVPFETCAAVEVAKRIDSGRYSSSDGRYSSVSCSGSGSGEECGGSVCDPHPYAAPPHLQHLYDSNHPFVVMRKIVRERASGRSSSHRHRRGHRATQGYLVQTLADQQVVQPPPQMVCTYGEYEIPAPAPVPAPVPATYTVQQQQVMTITQEPVQEVQTCQVQMYQPQEVQVYQPQEVQAYQPQEVQICQPVQMFQTQEVQMCQPVQMCQTAEAQPCHQGGCQVDVNVGINHSC